MTGWKVGWATGPRNLIAAAQAAHQYLTFCTARPLQVAMGSALRNYTGEYLHTLKQEYTERRDFLMKVLSDCGFKVIGPQGTYFIVADISPVADLDSWAFARRLVETYKVGSVPLSVFYARESSHGNRQLRFAFCKRLETLRAAADFLLQAREKRFA
jgi:aspartate/methionine/tyrosine aminotransferase